MKKLITIVALFISTISIGQTITSQETGDTITRPMVALYGLFKNCDTNVIITIYASPFGTEAPDWEYLGVFEDEGKEQYSIGVYLGFMYRIEFETVDKKKYKILYIMATEPKVVVLDLTMDNSVSGILFYDKETQKYKIERL